MQNLEFLESYSVAQFKAEVKCDSIDIIKNESTGKHFFSAGSISGAVSAKLDYKENPCFSKVRGTDGEVFWLLHKRTSNAVDTL